MGLAVCHQELEGHKKLADSTGPEQVQCLQVFSEAGGHVPDRNIERLLRNSHVPVPPDDLRRLDLIVPGLNVARGRPLFCDATVLSPLTRSGAPRGGTSNQGGRLLQNATTDNANHYHEFLTRALEPCTA